MQIADGDLLECRWAKWLMIMQEALNINAEQSQYSKLKEIRSEPETSVFRRVPCLATNYSRSRNIRLPLSQPEANIPRR
jgi:hypothetical protein